MNRLNETVRSYIEGLILTSAPMNPLWNREAQLLGKQPKWNYMDSCIISSLLRHYELSGDERLLSYAVRFMDCYVLDDGSIPTMKADDYNLDNLCGGRVLLSLYKKTGGEKWLRAAEKLIDEQVRSQPRLECGSFWHKAIYPCQIWLDGSYMAFPFMAEYGLLTGKDDLIGDVLRQLENMRSLMRDDKTGLYHHGYDEKREQPWADRETGLSREFWLRSMGWLSAALADLCELLPENEFIKNMLSELLEALCKFILDDGMLLQLPARRELEGNYPETSGTLLFAYSAIKAARIGAVSETIRAFGEKTLMTVSEKYITSNGEGLPILGNICLMAGLGGERDGSAAYYLSERITENEAKGIAPYLLAAAEWLKDA